MNIIQHNINTIQHNINIIQHNINIMLYTHGYAWKHDAFGVHMCWKMGNGSRVSHDLHGRYDIFPLPHLQMYNFQAKSLDLFANVLTDGNFICPSLVAAHNLVLPPTPRPRNVSVYVYYFDQVPHSLDILARTHALTPIATFNTKAEVGGVVVIGMAWRD